MKKIYLTGIEKIANAIENKVTIVNRRMFLKKLANLLDGVFILSKKVENSDKLVLIQAKPLG